MKQYDATELSILANRLRLDVVKMIGPNNRGHFGGSMSSADIVTALYFSVMNVDPSNPQMADRDRIILSKGHSCPVQYAALAHKGYFPVEKLSTLKNLGTSLQGHPDHAKLVGIEANTGSLGQGLSQAAGMGLALRKDAPNAHIFVLIGDGELDEGQNWEAAMFVGANKLNNVVAIVDRNRLQAMGATCDRLNYGEPGPKFAAFGWNVVEIDGHDMKQIVEALENAKKSDVPVCIVASTTKGKGIAIAENNVGFHNGLLTSEQFDEAVAAFEKVLGGKA